MVPLWASLFPFPFAVVAITTIAPSIEGFKPAARKSNGRKEPRFTMLDRLTEHELDGHSIEEQDDQDDDFYANHGSQMAVERNEPESQLVVEAQPQSFHASDGEDHFTMDDVGSDNVDVEFHKYQPWKHTPDVALESRGAMATPRHNTKNSLAWAMGAGAKRGRMAVDGAIVDNRTFMATAKIDNDHKPANGTNVNASEKILTRAQARAMIGIDAFGALITVGSSEAPGMMMAEVSADDDVQTNHKLAQDAQVTQHAASVAAVVVSVVAVGLCLVLVSYSLAGSDSGEAQLGNGVAGVMRSLSILQDEHAPRRRELVADIRNAILTQQRNLLIMYCDEAQEAQISLPCTKEEYLRQLDNASEHHEFINQTVERSRVNWSVNVWNIESDQFEICTVKECSIREMFGSSHAEKIFQAIAQQEIDAAASDIEDSLNDERHPFVEVPAMEHKRLMDHMFNAGSSVAGEAFLQWAAGVPVQHVKFVCAMTFEKINNTTSNQKFRLLMIREDLLRHVLKKDARSVHPVPYFQYRWKTLQQLHNIYYKKNKTLNEVREHEGALMITDPGKPLKFVVPRGLTSDHKELPDWAREGAVASAA